MLKQFVVCAAFAGLALTAAPPAQAAETITVQEICSYDSVLIPVMRPQGLTCAPTNSFFVPGIAVAVKAAAWPDAYPVDPANSWSDWVLPGGRASWSPTRY